MIDREQAIDAAARARHSQLSDLDRVVNDDYDFGPAEYMRYQLREEVTPLVDALLALPERAPVGERSVGGHEYTFALGPMDPEARRTEGRDFFGQMPVHQCRVCAALVVEDFMPEHLRWHALLTS